MLYGLVATATTIISNDQVRTVVAAATVGYLTPRYAPRNSTVSDKNITN